MVLETHRPHGKKPGSRNRTILQLGIDAEDLGQVCSGEIYRPRWDHLLARRKPKLSPARRRGGQESLPMPSGQKPSKNGNVIAASSEAISLGKVANVPGNHF
jgi:hypothetical protein